jgi:hypothetical protein
VRLDGVEVALPARFHAFVQLAHGHAAGAFQLVGIGFFGHVSAPGIGTGMLNSRLILLEFCAHVGQHTR